MKNREKISKFKTKNCTELTFHKFIVGEFQKRKNKNKKIQNEFCFFKKFENVLRVKISVNFLND
ncbi:hypothetical protein COV18_05985 [Candidatus Woesearchaeota archaeon CG10_big_fil_rev_8_21_14_0_10_37_12]|nr:MAG: hypothetical protein COV18_05985 [Candidatus Woesearchaeota archaeon CG10_big_fil_rev_8_21_14_0_10_37_12]